MWLMLVIAVPGLNSKSWDLGLRHLLSWGPVFVVGLTD